MSQPQKQEFGKWRAMFWPVYAYELKKLLPMLLLFFLILFNYTLLRDTKDTLIVTAPNSGAEAIPFLKVWGVLPGAVIFMIIYSKLSNVLSKSGLFYATITPFITFFAIFGLVLFPYRDALHPTAFCDRLQEILPAGFIGLIAILRNWTFSLFYVMSELWGSVALSLLFWGFANDITKVSESKRFYNLFGMGANFSLIVAGQAIQSVSNIREYVPAGVDPWRVSLSIIVGLVVLCGLAIIALYWWINRYVLTDPRFYDANEKKIAKKSKPKMSLKESFIYLLKSKYILCIAVIVFAYGISINLVEVTWKSQLKLQYPNANDYSAFMGLFSKTTGVVTILMMFFLTGNVVRRLGWTFAALTTPVVLLVTGALFFAFIIFRDNVQGFIQTTLHTTPLWLAVLFGMAQNIMSKSAKYSLFDPTKEMAYIPLDQEQKVKGKAAVDVVAARMGKSGGALIQQVLIVSFGSIAAITPFVGAILFVIILAWIIAAKSLGVQFGEQSARREREALEEAAAEANASTAQTSNENAFKGAEKPLVTSTT